MLWGPEIHGRRWGRNRKTLMEASGGSPAMAVDEKKPIDFRFLDEGLGGLLNNPENMRKRIGGKSRSVLKIGK
ncbi:hypothetical protein R1flu_010846 [Riccia fluitans]|uniref:Uncharacterized protein n=1 Tax=Riccia fluitans TaxID=41844 RepID=A0ABD1Z651_9MARC